MPGVLVSLRTGTIPGMAKKRLVDTKFWTDSFVLNELDPIEKLIYLYLITNPYTSICGIYELPLKVMAVETGLDKEHLEKVIIPRLESSGKICYRDGWIAIKNFIKNQNQGSKDVKLGIARELEKAPESLRTWINDGTVPRPSIDPMFSFSFS